MDASSRLPGHYPETPLPGASSSAAAAASTARYTPSSLGRAGGPIRKHNSSQATRGRAPSTPYQRPPLPQKSPTSGPRSARPHSEEEDGEEEDVRNKKSLGEKTAELVGTLVSGVKDWFSNSRTPKREAVQSVVPRKRTPQRSLTSRMEEGLDDDISAEVGLLRPTATRHPNNMFSPSLAPHYAGHTPYRPHALTQQTDWSRWVVKQRTNKGGVLAPEPPIFPLPNTNPSSLRRQDSKYATLPAKRSSALVPTTTTMNKRPRRQGSQSSIRQPKEWELSKDRYAEQDHETLAWCKKYGIDVVALANGTQKRPPLPSFQDIQRYEVSPLLFSPTDVDSQSLRNDVAFFERQCIRHIVPRHHKPSRLRSTTSSYELSRLAQENAALYIDSADSSASKLATVNKLLRLKESRLKSDLEAAQLERSKARNGYATINGGSSRASSRTRTGIVGDDVWILPGLHASLRPGSSGSRRSLRMRTLSPAVEGGSGSWRSQDGRRSRPRGRDIFPFDETMVDEGVQTQPLALPAPPSDTASMKDVEVIPRRKRPGVFSAREEDLDELEMVADHEFPIRKKQRLSTTTIPSGPKFAALWEPSRRDHWPLPEDIPPEATCKTTGAMLEDGEGDKVREELKNLESPAFKLPPSARKKELVRTGSFMDLEEPESPTGKKSTIVEGNGFSYKVGSPEKSPEPTPAIPTYKMDRKELKFDLPSPGAKPQFSPPKAEEKPTEKGTDVSPSKTATFMQSILSRKADEQMDNIPTFQTPKKNGVKASEPPHARSTQSTAPVSPPPQLSTGFTFTTSQSTNVSASPEKASSVNGAIFGGISSTVPATQTTIPPLKQEEKPPSPPKFVFGQAIKPEEAPKAEEVSKAESHTEPLPTAPKFNFEQSFKAEPEVHPSVPLFTLPKMETRASGLGSFGAAFKKSESEPQIPLVGKPKSPAPAAPVTATSPKAPESTAPSAPAPLFGSAVSSLFTFGQPPSTTAAPAKTETTPPPTSAPAPAITPNVAAEADESMDITESPPASRATPLTSGNAPSDVPSQYPPFPLSAPTSAPATTPVKPISFTFSASQVNGTSAAEKPAAQPFTFGGTKQESKATGGFSGGFNPPTTTNLFSPSAGMSSSVAPATNPFSPPAAPITNPFSPGPAVVPTVTAPSLPGFGGGGFGSAFQVKSDRPGTPNPAEAKASFGAVTSNFGTSTAPTESKPLFGQQASVNPPAPTESKSPFAFGATTAPTESKPLFGQQTANPPLFGTTVPTDVKSPFGSQTTSAFGPSAAPPLFGATPTSFSQQAPSVTSPPSTAPAPPSVSPFVPPTTTTAPSFATGQIPSFNFSVPQTGINPFSTASQPAAFTTTSAPVSPQNQPLPTFPGGQQFGGGAAQQISTPGGPIFGAAANTGGFGGHIPTFNFGAATDMARSSSDTGAGGTPGRRIAQPGRRRGHRRG